MRDWIQRNSVVISILAIVVILGLLALKLLPSEQAVHNSDNVGNLSWYYNVNTGKFLQDRLDRVTPFTTTEGHEIVRVVFFSCGACAEGERFPAFFVKHAPELKQKADADPAVAATLKGEIAKGRLYSFDGKQWFEAASAEAAGVHDRYRNTCDGKGSLKICR